MPEKTPRAPLPLLAITLSPFAWFYGRPDLFDSYRCWLAPCCKVWPHPLPAHFCQHHGSLIPFLHIIGNGLTAAMTDDPAVLLHQPVSLISHGCPSTQSSADTCHSCHLFGLRCCATAALCKCPQTSCSCHRGDRARKLTVALACVLQRGHAAAAARHPTAALRLRDPQSEPGARGGQVRPQKMAVGLLLLLFEDTLLPLLLSHQARWTPCCRSSFRTASVKLVIFSQFSVSSMYTIPHDHFRCAAALYRRYGDGGFTARPKGYDFSILDRSKGAGTVLPDNDSFDKIDGVTYRTCPAEHTQYKLSLLDVRPC
jgi:hypothetical protein